MLALHFELLPNGIKEAAAAKLAADVRGRSVSLSTGVLGTQFILDALANAGFADLAFGLLLRTEYPSWGYMVRQGATTNWETWEMEKAAQNHLDLAAVSGFLFRNIAGIETASPGFEKIIIRPRLDPRIPSGGGDYDSVTGPVNDNLRLKRDDNQGLRLCGMVRKHSCARMVQAGDHSVSLRRSSTQRSLRARSAGEGPNVMCSICSTTIRPRTTSAELAKYHSMPIKYFRLMILSFFGMFQIAIAQAHGDRPWGLLPLEWKAAQIAHAFSFGGTGRDATLSGKKCVTGGRLYFDVRDAYAFDIDESVRIDLDVYVASAGVRLVVGHQRGDAEPVELPLPAIETAGWHRLSTVLEKARFANAEWGGTDFFIAKAGGVGSEPVGAFSICTLSLSRSHSTPTRTTGRLVIEVTDEKGRATAARVGLYDPSGRAPIPSDDAIMLKTVYGSTRLIRLGMNVPPWPVKNRYVFYMEGRYHSRLPSGDYQRKRHVQHSLV